MNFKEEYEDLYNHWISELEQVNLTNFSEEMHVKYKKIKSHINSFNLINNDPIKIKIIKEFNNNFNYLFDDFFQIRKIKIINSAMAMEEINTDHLIDPEKVFYQNLVGSFKAYNKMKTGSLFETTQNELISEEISTLPLEKETIEVSEKKEPIESTHPQEETEYHYTLIRMLKKTPPLVGVDLKIYGPFEKEEVIYLPYKNAIILLNEKFAEKIEVI